MDETLRKTFLVAIIRLAIDISVYARERGLTVLKAHYIHIADTRICRNKKRGDIEWQEKLTSRSCGSQY